MHRRDHRGPNAGSTTCPRSDAIARVLPSTARTAVVPIATTTPGCTWAISSPSHGEHASISVALFAAGLPLEMLDRVGDVHGAAVDPGRLQRVVEDASRGPDERCPLLVLLVAGLLTHQRHDGGNGALAEDRLGGAPVEVCLLLAAKLIGNGIGG